MYRILEAGGNDYSGSVAFDDRGHAYRRLGNEPNSAWQRARLTHLRRELPSSWRELSLMCVQVADPRNCIAAICWASTQSTVRSGSRHGTNWAENVVQQPGTKSPDISSPVLERVFDRDEHQNGRTLWH
jgi:hypothetical protein